MRLHGLFYHDYNKDGSESEAIECVSECVGKLEGEVEDDPLAETWQQHRDYADAMLPHYVIKRVFCI